MKKYEYKIDNNYGFGTSGTTYSLDKNETNANSALNSNAIFITSNITQSTEIIENNDK